MYIICVLYVYFVYICMYLVIYKYMESSMCDSIEYVCKLWVHHVCVCINGWMSQWFDGVGYINIFIYIWEYMSVNEADKLILNKLIQF